MSSVTLNTHRTSSLALVSCVVFAVCALILAITLGLALPHLAADRVSFTTGNPAETSIWLGVLAGLASLFGLYLGLRSLQPQWTESKLAIVGIALNTALAAFAFVLGIALIIARMRIGV